MRIVKEDWRGIHKHLLFIDNCLDVRLIKTRIFFISTEQSYFISNTNIYVKK